MARALFIFDDRVAAQRAAERLAAMGLQAPRVHVHDDPAATSGELGRKIDEQVSGGLITNLYDLFQGVFDWDKRSPDEATVYREALTRGGAVVSVDVDDDATGQADVDRLMQAEGSERSTGWAMIEKKT